MRVINVKWLGPCPHCGNDKLMIFTNSTRNNYINSGELVNCPKCGREGHTDSDGRDAYVSWDELETKPPVTPLTKEAMLEMLARLVNQGSMDFVQHAVLTAYNRAGGPECQGLHTALGIISTLRLMKQEGHI